MRGWIAVVSRRRGWQDSGHDDVLVEKSKCFQTGCTAVYRFKQMRLGTELVKEASWRNVVEYFQSHLAIRMRVMRALVPSSAE